jgi:hypothetical protein
MQQNAHSLHQDDWKIICSTNTLKQQINAPNRPENTKETYSEHEKILSKQQDICDQSHGMSTNCVDTTKFGYTLGDTHDTLRHFYSHLSCTFW